MLSSIPFLQNEIKEFEEYFIDRYSKDTRFLNKLSKDMVTSGGKRLRPALVILSGMANNYDRNRIYPLAAAIETLHTATLVHDDIIDDAKTRRGRLTVSEKHGINMAVYTGDYLLANAFMFMAQSGLKPEKLDIMAKASKMICMGEVNQYLNRYKITSVAQYLKKIMRKTGVLFAASCAIGAFASECSEKNVSTMAKLGMNIGVIFQIRDDLINLDKNLSAAEGKPYINDMKSGIATLPFIYASTRSEKIKLKIEDFFQSDSIDVTNEIGLIVDEVIDAGGIRDSEKLKGRYLDKALQLVDGLKDCSKETRIGFEEFITCL